MFVREDSERLWWLGAGVLALLVAAILALRLSGPIDLLTNDQFRPAGYAVDIVANGAWIVQTDYTGDIASKPPMSTWVTALLSKLMGKVTLFTLALPCALSMLGAAIIIRRWGGLTMSAGAAMLGALMWLLSPYGVKHTSLIRTDAMFAFTVTLTALSAWCAWNTMLRADAKRSAVIGAWTLFWIAATIATLTKGPLGIVLGAMGLLAVIWEKRSTESEPRQTHAKGMGIGHIIGVMILLVIVGGWFVLAYRSAGQPFVDRVIGRELVGHALGDPTVAEPTRDLTQRVLRYLAGLFFPTLYFIGRFAPWSVLTLIGVWRAITHPATNALERRAERFFVCWFVGGIALFSVVPHQRADLLLPLVPAAALIAGREGWRWFAVWSRPKRAIAGVVVTALALGGVEWRYNRARQDEPEMQRAAAARELAYNIDTLKKSTPSLTILDVGGGGPVQFFLGIKQPRVEVAEAATALSGGSPVIVITRDVPALTEALNDTSHLRTITVESDPNAPFTALTNLP